jgi:hypothetical protein
MVGDAYVSVSWDGVPIAPDPKDIYRCLTWSVKV